jgi:hypothetical protein
MYKDKSIEMSRWWEVAEWVKEGHSPMYQNRDGEVHASNNKNSRNSGKEKACKEVQ